MDSDTEPVYSRWHYATSDARSEPIPLPRTPPAIVPPSSRTVCPPPPPQTPIPPKPTKISQGVYLDNDQVIYGKEWPPVLEYLDEVREAKTMLRAPSDLVLALAALSVLQHPEDIAHWIFWAQATYITIGELVDSIALQKSKLILSPIPWNGHREYKAIVNARQEKFTCVVVQRKWYPVDGTGADTHKRNLRSTATDQVEMTANDYFGIIENEGPSRRRNGKAAAKKVVQASPNKRTRRPVPVAPKARGTASPDPIIPTNDDTASATLHPESKPQETSPPPNRASTRVRRKVTPSARSPRIITAVVPDSPEEDTIPPAEMLPLPPVPSSASHSRNRSSSAQSSSSTETITVAERSASVTSVETAVAPSSPKKRKVDDGMDDDLSKELDADAGAAEGMVTRNRASKTRSGGDSDKSQPSSRMSTPVGAEPLVKAMRPRNRKRIRV